MNTRFLCCAALLLSGCEPQQPPVQAVGLLESERIELTADRSEPIVDILVAEGEQVSVGQHLLQIDPSRLQALRRQLQAQLAQAEARKAELVRGPRDETIAAEQARQSGARRELDYRKTELKRIKDVLDRGLAPEGQLDDAKAALDRAQAEMDASKARLAELKAGTRDEQIAQAVQAVVLAEAQLHSNQLDIDRLLVRAPADGVIDSLPFEVGEQPARGQIVAIMLTEQQPYARVFVPAQIRLQVAIGSAADVTVDGQAQPLRGTVQRITNDAAFTPYFALNERDRGRLSYIAEIRLPDAARRLPDGLPVTAQFPRP